MLQDARDELEQRRGDGSMGSGNKRPKTKPEAFKKPARPDILGGSRRTRTDVELEDEDWEDHLADTPTHARGQPNLVVPVTVGGRPHGCKAMPIRLQMRPKALLKQQMKDMLPRVRTSRPVLRASQVTAQMI